MFSGTLFAQPAHAQLIPESGTLALFGSGLIGLAALIRRRAADRSFEAEIDDAKRKQLYSQVQKVLVDDAGNRRLAIFDSTLTTSTMSSSTRGSTRSR